MARARVAAAASGMLAAACGAATEPPGAEPGQCPTTWFEWGATGCLVVSGQVVHSDATPVARTRLAWKIAGARSGLPDEGGGEVFTDANGGFYVSFVGIGPFWSDGDTVPVRLYLVVPPTAFGPSQLVDSLVVMAQFTAPRKAPPDRPIRWVSARAP